MYRIDSGAGTFGAIIRETKGLKLPAFLKGRKVSPRPLSPRASWIAATADWRTGAERLASYASEIEGSGEGHDRVVLLAGATRAEMGRVHDLTEGAVRLEDLSVIEAPAGVAWKGKDGRIRSTTNATTSAAVAACLARLREAKHGSIEHRAAKEALRELKAA